MAERYRKKNYRVRYDRIICVLAILLVLIFMLVSCVSGCANKKPNTNDPLQDGLSTGESTAGTDAQGNPVGTLPAATEPPAISYATTQLDEEDMHKGNLVLMNDDYDCEFVHEAIESGSSNAVNLVTIQSILAQKSKPLPYTAKDWEVGLDKEAAYAMDAWLSDFYAQGGNNDVRMIAGYRTDSQDLDFHTGRTLTLGIYPENSGSWVYKNEGSFSWIAEHAHEYGFVQRYPEGKENYFSENITDRTSGTFRYVGVAAATYMAENNECLEEYLNTVKSYTIDKMLEIKTDTAKYGVYYVPMNASGSTSFSVPSGGTPYEISGNNMDGYVVTVTLSGSPAVTMPTEAPTEADTTEAAE